MLYLIIYTYLVFMIFGFNKESLEPDTGDFCNWTDIDCDNDRY